MSNSILDVIYKYLDKNENVELIEIIDTNGSTPRSKGAMMVVNKNGQATGTIGGGLTEYLAIILNKKNVKRSDLVFTPQDSAILARDLEETQPIRDILEKIGRVSEIRTTSPTFAWLVSSCAA